MIASIASTAVANTAQQYVFAQSALPSRTVKSPEDTVQLSDAASKQSAPQPAPTLGQLVRDAANGDITALARLAVIG
jgi:hypothetical protein